MARAKDQVPVIPYRKTDAGILYCIFCRSDMADCWQFIPGGTAFTELETKCSIAAEVTDADLQISREHVCFEWVTYEEAKRRLRYDSNKTALWELDSKIRMGIIR